MFPIKLYAFSEEYNYNHYDIMQSDVSNTYLSQNSIDF